MGGNDYPIAVGGQFYAGSGTSASTPLFGGILTLANSARLTAGKSALGFVNPVLYKLDKSVFHTISSGDNKCTASNCCQYGFTCVDGWSPVTGRGSVKYQEFVSAVLALP